MANGVEIAGLVELGETLDILPQKVERKFIRRSIGKGAQVFKEAVKAHAPRITGRLFKAVSVKQLRPGSGSFTELIGFAFKGILAKKVGKVRNPARTQRSGAWNRGSRRLFEVCGDRHIQHAGAAVRSASI
jgi:hypothetical protein